VHSSSLTGTRYRGGDQRASIAAAFQDKSGDLRAFRRENAQELALYFCGAGSPVSITHGQKFCGFALSLPDLMTLIFAMMIVS
jgi:hypothetical protein